MRDITSAKLYVINLPSRKDRRARFENQDALHAILSADESFMQLPADVRFRFENDPAQFVDFSDGIALVGVRHLKSAQPTATQSVSINGGSKKVSIKNSVTNLKTVLDHLITALTTLAVNPSTHMIMPTTVTALTNVQAELATLMDEGIL